MFPGSSTQRRLVVFWATVTNHPLVKKRAQSARTVTRAAISPARHIVLTAIIDRENRPPDDRSFTDVISGGSQSTVIVGFAYLLTQDSYAQPKTRQV
jgi:hypothetical protein